MHLPPALPLFPYTTLFRSVCSQRPAGPLQPVNVHKTLLPPVLKLRKRASLHSAEGDADEIQWRSEEHTSELQSRGHLVCRLLLEKKRNYRKTVGTQGWIDI